MKLPCLAHAALLLIVLAAVPVLAAESGVHQQVQSLHDKWSDIFYRLPVDEQAEKFEALLPRVHSLIERYPHEAEPLVILKKSVKPSEIPFALSLSRVDGVSEGSPNGWTCQRPLMLRQAQHERPLALFN